MAKYHELVSSARLPNARRPECVPLEQQQRSLEKVQRYLDAPAQEDALVNDNTKTHRKWLMKIWNEYFCERGIDPDTIWIGLCEGDHRAAAYTKAFFSDYVEHSTRRVMVLGSEEYVDKRMLNSASTVLAMWRKLVKEADLTVLEAKRHQEPLAQDKWRLRYHAHTSQRPTSSIATYDISRWLWKELTEEAELTKELTFEKLEATADDVLVILRTLWERAADLGINAETRISFHANVLLSAMGGFRPGCLGKVCYKDIVLSVLRDPLHPSKVKHVATVTIKRNKMKDSLSASKSDKVKFSAFFVPFSLVCLGRLVVSRAIQDNAFDPGFADAKELLTRPVLGDVDYITLKWKDEVLNRRVFGLSYRQFNDIWHRICWVAGFRTQPRLYALRVGAGARMDENPLFSNALRNYIMSHTGDMFEKQYQTSRVREDLVQAAFGQRTGSHNGPLFALLRNISLSRDSNAPVDITPTEWAEFEAREDATTLRTAMTEARHEKDLEFLKTLRSRFKYLRHSWKSLKLADNRRKYFEWADRSRAQGQQPPRGETKVSNHVAEIRSRQSNAQMANQVLKHIVGKWNTSNDDEDPGRYIDLLVAYLNRCSKVNLDVWEEEDEGEEEKEEDEVLNDDEDDDNRGCKGEDDDRDRKNGSYDGTEEKDEAGFECVLCDLDFISRSTLTGHYDDHKRTGKFEAPFQCPECRRNKVNTPIEKGFVPWLKHLEEFHGKRYTPHFPQTLKYPEIYPCPLPNCGTQRKGKRYNSRGLNAHFSHGHVEELDANGKDKLRVAIKCHRCISQGAEESSVPLIESIPKWRHHFDSVHCSEKQKVFQCYICLGETRTAGGLKMHCYSLHEKRENFFTNPFPCPECVRAGLTDAPQIRGRKAWQAHVKLCHNGGAKEKPLDTSVRSPETLLHHPCLICLRCHSSPGLLASHLFHAHGELFEKTFQCPECVRNGDRDGESFNNKSAWKLHVAREHPAHMMDSTSCPCSASPDVSLTPASSVSGRAKRVKVKELDSELDTEVELPSPPRYFGVSTASATSSNGRSGHWDSSSEKSLASNSTYPDLDDMVFARPENAQSLTRDPRDQKSKRKRVADGLEPKDAPPFSTLSHPLAASEDIPIDPYLLGLS